MSDRTMYVGPSPDIYDRYSDVCKRNASDGVSQCGCAAGARLMIDVLIAPAHAHGGCYECDPNDDRGDDIRVFKLGQYVIRLCRVHAQQLVDGLLRAARTEGTL